MQSKYNIQTSRIVNLFRASVAELARRAFNAVVSATVREVVTHLALAALVVFGGCTSHCRSTVQNFTANNLA